MISTDAKKPKQYCAILQKKKKNPQAERNSDLATERPVLDGGELCQNFSRAGNPDTIKNHIVHDDTVPEFLCLQKKFGQDKSQLMLNAQQVYNFLLLDQIDGLVYQVQWSLDSDKR